MILLHIALVALLVWTFTATQADPAPLISEQCSGLQADDLDACLDSRFADDFGEDPREPFGGGAP